ncbi:DNA replication regulator SLD3-domain-containing protein [Nemania sp. FL0916]|nr:DNA replication regulator SLD3-domain-containing protein [Nemania sp. FL0916]
MSTRVQVADALRRQRPGSSSSSTPFRHGHNAPTVNALTVPTSSAKARDSTAMEDLLRRVVVIKPHPPNLTVQPRSLQPLMLLPREHLSLSFLDLASPHGAFEPAASYEASIKILDLESRMGNRPVVLIARFESNKSTYAIERQSSGLHVLCRLGAWVDLEQLCTLATVSCPALIAKPQAPLPAPTVHAPMTTPQMAHTNNKKRLAIEGLQSVIKRPPTRSRDLSVSSHLGETSGPPTPAQPEGDVVDTVSGAMVHDTPPPGPSTPKPATESQADAVQDQDEALTLPTAEGIFDNIRNQYLEALYHSMGSLAYFAKGPLSRARAAFHLDCDATLEMRDLVEFLKSLVMTTTQIDKKYREAIPKIQSEMRFAFNDSDVEEGQTKKKPRKRKSNKVKLGKDGLYPNEDDHIRRWWTVHKPIPKDDEQSTTISTEQHDTKLHISLLRSRETQLQMIIILEVLSLEPLVASEPATMVQLPGELPAAESISPPKETPVTKRKKHNFPFLLDMHADRLCIWQSTVADEISVMNESQTGLGPDPRVLAKFTSDPLKDFCVDVIGPFFSARLPEHCDSINRKLGGPVKEPPKPVPKKVEPTKPKSKPSGVTKRPAPPKSTKTLERSLSKETERNRRSISRGPSGVIALMRSASMPTVPRLKREGSERRSLASIPKADSMTGREQHVSSAGPISAQRRAETKEKKDALVRAELQDAISTLRRPNRDVVGKAMAEADERRAITNLSQLKKSRKPTQHRVQDIIKATPVGNRFHDIFAKEQGFPQTSLPRFNVVSEDQSEPSSSIVPSSAPRKRNREAAFGSESAAQSSLGLPTESRIITTPAKSSRLSRNFLSATQPDDEGVVLASSPVVSRKNAQPKFAAHTQPTTLGHRDSGITMPSSPTGFNILDETPIKPRQNNTINSMDHYVTVTPMKKGATTTSGATSAGKTEARDADHDNENIPKKKMTIFEKLGWDDDYGDVI